MDSLHDFAQVAGHGELLAAPHSAGFDEDDVAADWCPHQADCYAGFLDALVDFTFGAELRHTEEFANHLGCDDHLLRLAFRNFARLFAD